MLCKGKVNRSTVAKVGMCTLAGLPPHNNNLPYGPPYNRNRFVLCYAHFVIIFFDEYNVLDSIEIKNKKKEISKIRNRGAKRRKNEKEKAKQEKFVLVDKLQISF